MPAVQRSGDANSAGGVARSGISSVLVNGRPILAGISQVAPHPCCGKKGCQAHCAARAIPKPVSVFVEGKPVILTGLSDSCGHSRSGGSPNVFVGR